MQQLIYMFAIAALAGVGHAQDYTKLFIVGGNTYLSSVEVVDMSSVSTNCVPPADYPIGISSMPSTSLALSEDGSAVVRVCGGRISENDDWAVRRCFDYSAKDDSWTEFAPMQRARLLASSVQFGGIGGDWWITGGMNRIIHNTTEVLRAGSVTFETGPDLPEVMRGHCMAAINSTHAVLTYGYGAWLGTWTDSTWTQLASTTFERRYHACGVVDDGREVVVAGGFPNDTVVEVLDLATMRWRVEREMPVPVRDAAVAQRSGGAGFLLVGGYSGHLEEYTSILEYQPELGHWFTHEQTTSIPRTEHAAILVPDELVQCA